MTIPMFLDNDGDPYEYRSGVEGWSERLNAFATWAGVVFLALAAPAIWTELRGPITRRELAAFVALVIAALAGAVWSCIGMATERGR